MIVRTVHNHLPEKQVDKGIFFDYISSKKKIKKGSKKEEKTKIRTQIGNTRGAAAEGRRPQKLNQNY